MARLLDQGRVRERRNGRAYGLFGEKLRFDLREGFPLLTTKKVHWKSIVAELLWMLSGDTNVRALQTQGVRIWDEWADENGDLGPVYGHQWRSWGAQREGGEVVIDQITMLIEGLRHWPHDSGHVVSAWNVADLDQMALRPCHCLFQFYIDGDHLDCQLYQRSADAFLGLPFNIASYSLLTTMVATVLGLKPGVFTHVLGDVHLYADHVTQAQQQLGRLPHRFPRLAVAQRTSIDGWLPGDFTLSGYDPHPTIPAPVSK